MVAVVTDQCSGIAAYVENGGYAAGSKAKNAGKRYECKEFPYSGWCNGAAWAYAPGTGAYWGDAWTSNGSCTARLSSDNETATTVNIAPNPTEGSVTLEISDLSIATVQIIDMYGKEVMRADQIKSGDQLDISTMAAGVYVIKINTPVQFYTRTIVKK